jgi:hypothetical protein
MPFPVLLSAIVLYCGGAQGQDVFLAAKPAESSLETTEEPLDMAESSMENNIDEDAFGHDAEDLPLENDAESSMENNIDEDAFGQDAEDLPLENDTVHPEIASLEFSASHGYGCRGQNWRTKFNTRLYHCALETGANARRGGECMARKQRVSGACGACMGKLMHCGLKCAKQCCGGKCISSRKCVSCNARRCNGSFESCAGVHL